MENKWKTKNWKLKKMKKNEKKLEKVTF